jgi:hypothetical protein
VIGWEIGVVLEGPGSFAGAADLFRIGFGDRDTTHDFEVTAATAIEVTVTGNPECGTILLKATVTPPTPGEVEFFDGPAALGATPVGQAVARLTVTGLAVGPHRLVAVLGPPGCSVASDTLEYEASPFPSTTALTLSRQTLPVGDPLALTATVTPAHAAGDVEFFDGALSLGRDSLEAGVARLIVSLPEGLHALTAVYSGDGCHLPSSAAANARIDALLMAIGDSSVLEKGEAPAPLVFTVTLSGLSTRSITVHYATGDSTAVAGEDYQPAAGLLTFAPGETSKRLSVVMLDDPLIEGAEVFLMVLSDPAIATLADAVAFGVIRDDDTPLLTIVPPVRFEGHTDTTGFTFALRLSHAIPLESSARYEIRDGSATVADQDYLPVQGVVAFAPGQTVAQIVVSVLGDSLREHDETLVLRLSEPRYLTLQADSALATIRNDDDWIPAVRVDDAQVSESGAGSQGLAFRLSLYPPAGLDTLRVGYATIDLIARQGSDYDATTGVLRIPPRQREAWIAVPIRDDPLCEGDERFTLFLQQPVGCTLADNRATGTILDDDCVTPTLVTLFRAEPGPEGIELCWQLADPGASAEPERGESRVGPWRPLDVEPSRDGDAVVALDRAVESRASYWYRLVVRSASGARIEFGPVAVAMGAGATDFGLGPLSPNPSPGRTAIEFQVARPAPVRLAVLDVQGREVAVLAAGGHEPGRYVAVWNGETAHGPAPAGLYFVRYSAAGRAWTRRLALAP